MATRPQNVGIKAIEIYFPSQVGLNALIGEDRYLRPSTNSFSASTKQSLRNSMVSAKENIQLALAKQR